MKARLILASLIITLFGIAMSSQIKSVAAEVSTNPITGPISNPITYFTYKLSGNISYRISRWTTPAKGVLVNIKNINTGNVYSVKTDVKGNYSITLNNGTYNIKPFAKRVRFIPEYALVNLNKDIQSINFVGYKTKK